MTKERKPKLPGGKQQPQHTPPPFKQRSPKATFRASAKSVQKSGRGR